LGFAPYATAPCLCRGRGVCVECQRWRSNRNLAALNALVAGDVRGFGAFGARSYTTPQVECSVGDYDGKPNGWENWCNCMFSSTDPNRAKCRKKPCANPFDSNPDCVFGLSNPNLSWAPWTEIGAGARGIPKEDGGLLYLFGSSFAPIDAKEFEPHNFFVIADRDPLRAAWLLSSAPGFLSSPAANKYPYAVPLWQLQAHYATMGSVLASIPVVGGAITALNAAQFFLPMSPLALQATSAAFQYALKKDPTGELYVNTVLPVKDARFSDLIRIVLGGAQTIFGDVGGIATVVEVLCKRAARMLPDSGAPDVKVAKALLEAAAAVSPQIASLIKDAQTTLQSSALYSSFGAAVQKVAIAMRSAGVDNTAVQATNTLGNALSMFAPSLSVAARAIATKDDRLLCCGADSAFDLIPINVPGLGFKMSALIDAADAVAKAGGGTTKEIQNTILRGDKAQQGIKNIQALFGAIQLFATELEKALKPFGNLGKYFSDAIANFLKQKDSFNQVVEAAKTGEKVTEKTPKVKPQEDDGLLARLLLGAGGGFVLGGPPGAVIGAGAAVALTGK
jgi:hypothetical protein